MNTFALFNTHRWPFVGPLIPGSTPCSKPHSVGVPEVWRSFNDQFLTIRFSIGPSEIDKVLDHQKNVESLFSGEQWMLHNISLGRLPGTQRR